MQYMSRCLSCQMYQVSAFLVSMPKASKVYSWLCDRCSLAKLPFYRVSSLNDIFVDKSLDDVDDIVDMEHEDVQLSPMEWFNCNINGYYKNNLKIRHLNVNSIYGKADEIIDLLSTCQFDILFIPESKIDCSVSNSLFAHSNYRIIRRDRKKALVVYWSIFDRPSQRFADQTSSLQVLSRFV